MIFDTQRSYVDALRLALDMTADLQVVAAEQDLEVGVERIPELEPSVIVIGGRPCSKVECTDAVGVLRASIDVRTRAGNPLPIAVLTSFPTPGLARVAQEYVGVSVISKQSPITDIVRSLRAVVRGEELYLGIHDDPFGLSRAEIEVLELLAKGCTATVIAEELHLSVHAIRARIRGVLTKTSSGSQLESVSKAIGAGVVAPPLLGA